MKPLLYGDIVHYNWGYGNGEKMHSASMVIGHPPNRAWSYLLLVSLSDLHLRIGMTAPIVAKAAYAYRPCDATCSFNPDYEGDPS